MSRRAPAPPTTADIARDARRESLGILLSRLERKALTAPEAALLRAHVHVEIAESDILDRTRRGLDRHRQEQRRRLDAADRAIVEAEAERDQALAALAEVTERADRLNRDLHITNDARQGRDRAEQFLARLHQADTYGDVLAILGEHQGLTPAAARAAAAFAAAAETQDAVLAEQEREHAVALATEKQRADRAEALLDRVRAARTWVDLWTHLGMRYGYTAEQAGQEARARRTLAERLANERADTATHKADTMKHRVTRLRARVKRAEKRANRAEAERNRERKYSIKAAQRIESYRARAEQAEATLAAIRSPKPIGTDHPMYDLLDAMTGPGIGDGEARQHIGAYFRAITQQEPTP
ncbi:hypothetical protein ACFUGD_06575 [Streptomyces sp. NPDC057217]|uniref:hypothetical protein n=1 Tax=Streptomyces sp. NPDC057217 TaxID=3346054 RepID=UPI00363BD117